MKQTINTQSQNEVKDLLNEYVVSPINQDISATLLKMNTSIESLETCTKKNTDEFLAVNGRIDRLRKSLDNSFHFEDEEDAFEKIQDDINTIIDGSQGIITKNLGDSQNAITTKIDKSQGVITKKYDDSQNAITKKIDENQGVITKKYDDSQNAVTKKIDEYQGVITQKFDDCQGAITDKIDNNQKNLSDVLASIETIIKQLENDNKEINNEIDSIGNKHQELIEKKHKNLFVISLAFGIANTIGIIALILLYFLK